jgi:hypothetical protein
VCLFHKEILGGISFLLQAVGIAPVVATVDAGYTPSKDIVLRYIAFLDDNNKSSVITEKIDGMTFTVNKRLEGGIPRYTFEAVDPITKDNPTQGYFAFVFTSNAEVEARFATPEINFAMTEFLYNPKTHNFFIRVTYIDSSVKDYEQ